MFEKCAIFNAVNKVEISRRRVHRVVFVDFKNHLFRADLGFLNFFRTTHTAARRGFGGSNSRNSKALNSKIVQSAPPARPCTSIVDVYVYTRARAVPVCRVRTCTRMHNLACARAHMQDHVWRLRAGTGKLLIFFACAGIVEV